jgi:hypothetical protein
MNITCTRYRNIVIISSNTIKSRGLSLILTKIKTFKCRKKALKTAIEVTVIAIVIIVIVKRVYSRIEILYIRM